MTLSGDETVLKQSEPYKDRDFGPNVENEHRGRELRIFEFCLNSPAPHATTDLKHEKPQIYDP